MKRRTLILEEIFNMLATPTQKEKLLSIYRTGNKGSANHFQLCIIYDKVRKLLNYKEESKTFFPFHVSATKRTIKINSRNGNEIVSM